MKYSPHEYQSYATDFIINHPAAAILLDMGLGKSVITLSAMTPAEEVHHILPVSKGGRHTDDNLMSLCRSCHNKVHYALGDR